MKPRMLTGEAAERMFPKGLLERVVGSDEDKRATKTWLPNGNIAFKLDVVEVHAQRLRDLLHRISGEGGPKPSMVEASKKWPIVDTWRRFHLGGLEHLGSVHGHNLQVLAGLMDKHQDEATQRAKPRRREGEAADAPE